MAKLIEDFEQKSMMATKFLTQTLAIVCQAREEWMDDETCRYEELFMAGAAANEDYFAERAYDAGWRVERRKLGADKGPRLYLFCPNCATPGAAGGDQ